ncbi:maleylacetoacetate isomerase [Roseateles violae]|uniref:Maleylacetoacetate isomerase n=1 Tax=Roseateles violae TaxID=3058042 RepID=A0ABT8DWI4_9BURK|nr:maleylacetoacetate isomerase [Pelomonas sp. PFR6]MDN3922538.1 maleylacetoacetate isomerase [Pelomonas sp. PFR6]
MTLFTYFRSSASYRVRIALALKRLPHGAIPIHLVRNGGEQHSAEFASLNPAHLVPVLMDGPHTMSQSLAILEYLEERYPEVPLLPTETVGRARVRGLAQSIACEIHPLNNLRVLQYMERDLHIDEEARARWYRHWVALGFEAIEHELRTSPRTGAFCHGDAPTIADCCLVPQVYNARRFNVSLDSYPTIVEIVERCDALPAFRAAAPAVQADAA